MGHWQICIDADAAPEFGSGNNKPESPCSTPPAPEPNHNPDIGVGGDGTVHVDNDFCANIKCLGESVVFNNSQGCFRKSAVQY
jgi:hypothetical protein